MYYKNGFLSKFYFIVICYAAIRLLNFVNILMTVVTDGSSIGNRIAKKYPCRMHIRRLLKAYIWAVTKRGY